MLLLKDATANYAANNVGRAIQLTTDRASLMGEFLLGRDEATTVFNSAYEGAPPGTMVGAPTYGDHRITGCDQTNYLNTGITDAANISILAIYSPGGAVTGDGVFGTGGVSGAQIAGFVNGANLQLQCATSGNSTTGLSVTCTAPGTNLSDYRGLAGRIGGTVNPTLKIDDFKDGARVTGGSATGSATRGIDTRNIRIGTWGSSSGLVDVAAALIWHRLLTDAEMLAAYQEVRATLAQWNLAC